MLLVHTSVVMMTNPSKPAKRDVDQKPSHAPSYWELTDDSVCQVFLTPTHLALAMEYAPNGDLYHYVSNHRPQQWLLEDHARYYFQQLIIGLDYCHRKVCTLGPSCTYAAVLFCSKCFVVSGSQTAELAQDSQSHSQLSSQLLFALLLGQGPLVMMPDNAQLLCLGTQHSAQHPFAQHACPKYAMSFYFAHMC